MVAGQMCADPSSLTPLTTPQPLARTTHSTASTLCSPSDQTRPRRARAPPRQAKIVDWEAGGDTYTVTLEDSGMTK